MTDVTTCNDQGEPRLSAADEQLLRELAERARTGGLKLTGEGGLLGRLTKMVVEGALEGELDDHLGYAKHDPAGRDSGNSRNGHRAKTVLTEAGSLALGQSASPISASHRSASWLIDTTVRFASRTIMPGTAGSPPIGAAGPMVTARRSPSAMCGETRRIRSISLASKPCAASSRCRHSAPSTRSWRQERRAARRRGRGGP